MSKKRASQAVRRKVLLDIFAAPSTLLPVAGGLTALMASWATSGNAMLTFAGIAGVLGGIGVCASRLILGLDKLTQDAYDFIVDRQRADQESALELLDDRLVQDRDPRTQNCLRELRNLYSSLKAKVDSGRITPAAYDVIEGVDKMFSVCVQHLGQSLELWETAKTMRGPSRESILQQRNELIEEVCKSVVHLGSTVEQFHLVTTQKNRQDLARLREELDESLEIARRVEERKATLAESNQYSDFQRE
ncbi:MAG: hypothetical protein KDB27_00055 [Planctomycetales bacterium]|nr:hypothetical protein [Planctomycetales bacterium]